MLPDPLSTTVAAAEASATPQLRLAARTGPHPDPEMPTIAAVIQEVVDRSHEQWRGSLDAVKETVATLERESRSALEVQKAGVAELIETLVANAAAEAAEAATAAQQTQARAQTEIAELQGAVAKVQAVAESLQTDLEAERGRVSSISAQLDEELAARLRAETERDEARRHCQQEVAAANSQLAVLRSESDAQRAELALTRQQLDAAVAERSKLMATFQMVQRALALGSPGDVALPAQDGGHDAAPVPEAVPQPWHAEITAAPEALSFPSESVADARVTLTERHPEVVEDVRRVLEQIEAMYQLDLESGRSAMEVVDSLTSSLRYAREVIVARWNSDDRDAETLFDYQVDVLLQTHEAAAFGRHLSIAAYASRQPAASPPPAEAGTTPENISLPPLPPRGA